jgi:hypothetical protein
MLDAATTRCLLTTYIYVVVDRVWMYLSSTLNSKPTLQVNTYKQDLFGPITYISIGGSKYCLVIVDDYSRFTWVFFLQENLIPKRL